MKAIRSFFVVLYVCGALCLACSEAAFPAKEGDRLKEIRTSFEKQKSLFETLLFKARYIQPYQEIVSGPVSRTARPELRTDDTRLSVTEMEYQLDRDGRFFFQKTPVTVLKADMTEEKRQMPTILAFDGEKYRHLTVPGRGGQASGSIFLPGQPHDYSKPMIKPTSYMDHLFDEKIEKMLLTPAAVTITETTGGMWQLDYVEEDSQDAYRLELDPKKDFMIVMMQGPWTSMQGFTKRAEYAQSEEGFWYPVKGTLSVGDKDPTVLEVTEFKLNTPVNPYSLEIPIGTRMTDHTDGQPRTYFEGQPHRLE